MGFRDMHMHMHMLHVRAGCPRRKNFTRKLPRTTLGTGLARTRRKKTRAEAKWQDEWFLLFQPFSWLTSSRCSRAPTRRALAEIPAKPSAGQHVCACACVPALHDLGGRDLQSPSPHPWSLPDTTRAARVGAAATAAAAGGAVVAGEPLRRVDAPTPLLLRSPALAKVQSHSHHLLRQVGTASSAFAFLVFLSTTTRAAAALR